MEQRHDHRPWTYYPYTHNHCDSTVLLEGLVMFEPFFKFNSAMWARLAQKQRARWTGWDTLSDEEIESRLIKSLDKKNWVDVANFAFFAWYKQQRGE